MGEVDGVPVPNGKQVLAQGQNFVTMSFDGSGRNGGGIRREWCHTVCTLGKIERWCQLVLDGEDCGETGTI